jgi:hypothetical protein
MKARLQKRFPLEQTWPKLFKMFLAKKRKQA